MIYSNWDIEDLKFEIGNLLKNEKIDSDMYNIIETALYKIHKQDKEMENLANFVASKADDIIEYIEEIKEDANIDDTQYNVLESATYCADDILEESEKYGRFLLI